MATEIDDGKLIECVKNFPSIYDKNHGDYRNKQSKMSAWITVGQKLKVPEELCEQRWIVLRNRYATELRRRKNKSSSNNGTGWRFSEVMSFLEEYISPRRTRGSLVIGNNRKFFSGKDIKSDTKFTQSLAFPINGIPPEALVTVELGCASPNSNNNNNLNNNHANNTSSTTTRLRPIAPRPAFTTVARFVKIRDSSESSTAASGIQSNNTLNCQSQSSECQEKQEDDDEDILFGRSIGHTLRDIKNKKTKLQVKSEILSILAQHTE